MQEECGRMRASGEGPAYLYSDQANLFLAAASKKYSSISIFPVCKKNECDHP